MFISLAQRKGTKETSTPKAPYIGGCKRKVAETADFDFVELAGAQQTPSKLGLYSLNRDFPWVLATRDTRYIVYHKKKKKIY